jgi:predicted ATPase
MKISKIHVENFKSFNELTVSLGNYNVLIGENAAGKSNFVNLLQFISDIFNYGLDNAISMQGGRDYIRNINVGFQKELSLSIEIEPEEEDLSKRIIIPNKVKEDLYEMIFEKYIYKFKLYFLKTRIDYKISYEALIGEGELYTVEIKGGSLKRINAVDKIKIILEKNDKETFPIRAEFSGKDIDINLNYLTPRFPYEGITSQKPNTKKLLLEDVSIPSFALDIVTFFKQLSVYSIDPKLPKRSAIITGKNELDFDGSNLSLVLKRILEDKKTKSQFSMLVKDILPFVEDISIERYSDKSVIANLKETYSKKKYFPASLLSDGTINIITIIIILYFEKKPFIIIEEPERSMHPYLISKMINMMNEVIGKKQILLTTHNPEIVKYTKLNNLYCIKRDAEGFSIINKASEMEFLSDFLENDLGLDHLFIKNLIK